MKNRKNNKGFSLVELIVVVAIMAVLVGVLAPAYLRYVEKSRLQKDVSAVSEVVTAIEVAAASEATYEELSKGAVTVAISSGAVDVTYPSGVTTTLLETELAKTISAVELKSKALSSGVTLNVSIEANGNVKITHTAVAYDGVTDVLANVSPVS